MVYMFSANVASSHSTPLIAGTMRGRRRETPGPVDAFTVTHPAGWTSDLNRAILALAVAGFVAPQFFLYPPAAAALFGATFIVNGIAARHVSRRINITQLRRWASKHQSVQLTPADAQAILDGGATATHRVTRHGDHLHLEPLGHPAEPSVEGDTLAVDQPRMSPAALVL